MNENLNNENNNYVELQKNNNGVKILLIIVIILLLAVLLLLGYKVFIKDKKENDKSNENNIVEKENNTYEKINYEIKEEQDGEITIQYLYVNNKKIEETKTIESIKVEQFKNLLIVNVGQPGYARNVVVILDKVGKEIKLNSPSLNYGDELIITSGGVAHVENDILYISYNRYNDGRLYWYCDVDKNEITKYEIKYNYLGNGQFSNGEIVNEKTIAEIYTEEIKDC